VSSADPSAADPERLPARTKLGFALGDHALNLALSALSLFYLVFLTDVAGLRPALASAVLFTGRVVDAFADPLMGRLSDLTRTRWGRRRPYFLIGALPFGASFAALWLDPTHGSQAAKFAWFAALYVGHSLLSTVIGVPYVAAQPEMTLDYQERNSLGSFRAAGSVLGTLVVAATVQPLVGAFGGGAQGFAVAGLVLGIWIALPWLVVFRVTRERPEFQRPSSLTLLAGARTLVRHASYRRLVVLYLCSRVAMDVAGAILVFYFKWWIGRPDDVSWALGLLLVSSVLSLPGWLWLGRRLEKRTLFVAGTAWWLGLQGFFFLAGPETPRGLLLALAALMGLGYAMADMVPWSMLGEVVDEDELATGERREGVYGGVFTFLRKLAGASAVGLVGVALDLAGFVPAARAQSAEAVLAIRAMTAAAPAVFLALSIAIALRYGLGRREHRAILAGLHARELARRGGR